MDEKTSGMAPTPFQKYACHKIVEAFKISKLGDPYVDINGRKVYPIWSDKPLRVIDGNGVEHNSPYGYNVDIDFIDKHKLIEEGGYIVRYQDGYVSYSPAKAFEDEYTLIAELNG